MRFAVAIELELVEGAAQDEETMLDLFAATIGKQNAARSPLMLTVTDVDGEVESTYVVELVDDRDVRLTSNVLP